MTRKQTERYELQLFCEQPDGPHPLPDGAGGNMLHHLPDTLRRCLRLVLAALRYTVPLVGPALVGLTDGVVAGGGQGSSGAFLPPAGRPSRPACGGQ